MDGSTHQLFASLSKRRKSDQQRSDTIPQNLDADANQQERRQAHDNAHRRLSQRSRQPVCERVTQVDAYGGDQAADKYLQKSRDVPSALLRRVSSQCDGDRNRSRTNREGQRQWIKRNFKLIAWRNFLAHLSFGIVIVSAI